MATSAFQPEFFEREDTSPDPLFYAEPRMVAHIDDQAIAAVERLYGELLPRGGDILDLMSSRYSHIPESLCAKRIAGLGLNAAELGANPQLTEWTVHDLNADPRLPYDDHAFDGVVVTVSIQYLITPVDVFRDIARVLKPGAPLIVTYSNRMFPTKAVAVWRMLSDHDRASLVATYFKESGAFGDVSARDCTLRTTGGGYNDPLFGVWAYTLP